MKTSINQSESIRIHSEQSGYYAYRTPYIPPLFETVCRELHISKNSVLMDMACGRGEVASLLSPHAGVIHGVDGSTEMIALATRLENIKYQVADLNAISPQVDEKVDHFFFGRSIHWFTGASLLRLSRDVIKDNGCIVVCSTQWSPVGDWGTAYTAIRNQFIPKKGNSRDWDFTGQTQLGEAGFTPIQRFDAQATMQATCEFMVGHTFATTYDEQLRALEQKRIEFSAAMHRALAKHEQKNALTWNIHSWAIVYARA